MWAQRAEKGQPAAQYVGTTSTGRASHAVRGVWNYEHTNIAKCGKTLSGVEHLQSGDLLAITCKACIRAM